MAKVSVFWRIARSLKSLVINRENADSSKRIEFSQSMVDRRDRVKKAGIRQVYYDYIMEDSGMTLEEIKDKVDRLRALDITTLSLYKFMANGIYKMDDEEAVATLYKMKESVELEDDLKWEYRLVDLGKKSFDDPVIKEKIERFKALESGLLTDDAKMEIAMKAAYLHPENMSKEEIDDLVMDMEFTRRIIGYGHNGYSMFRLAEKTIPERREFISGKERLMLLPDINTAESIAILDDKLLTYERLKDHFGRDMISIDSEKDYFRFKSFFENNDAAVIKPRFDSLGKGIRLIHKSEIKNYRKYFLKLVDEYRRFLLEGFIEAADEIKALNPDSVNTVRIIAYFDGENTSIRSASMRIGHKGSFVDNAGAGGLTVAIDKKTGMIDSDGCDERGFRYERHPDTGIKFNGYQLPEWDKALAVVYDVSGRIEGAKYVGWDLALTKDHEWVIVEANGKTGFFGAQAPHDNGRRREFLKTVGADPRGALYNEVALKMAEEVKEEEGIPVEETMEKLRHFESLGLDGRYFKANRAWELTDEQCLQIEEAKL